MRQVSQETLGVRSQARRDRKWQTIDPRRWKRPREPWPKAWWASSFRLRSRSSRARSSSMLLLNHFLGFSTIDAISRRLTQLSGPLTLYFVAVVQMQVTKMSPRYRSRASSRLPRELLTPRPGWIAKGLSPLFVDNFSVIGGASYRPSS